MAETKHVLSWTQARFQIFKCLFDCFHAASFFFFYLSAFIKLEAKKLLSFYLPFFPNILQNLCFTLLFFGTKKTFLCKFVFCQIPFLLLQTRIKAIFKDHVPPDCFLLPFFVCVCAYTSIFFITLMPQGLLQRFSCWTFSALILACHSVMDES